MPPCIGIATVTSACAAERRRQPGAFVADRDRPRLAQPRVVEIASRHARGGDHLAAARGENARPTRTGRRPRRSSSRSARPARRAAPSATTRTRSASTAGLARRPRQPRCAGSCRRCPGPADRRAGDGTAPAPVSRARASRSRPARRCRPAARTPPRTTVRATTSTSRGGTRATSAAMRGSRALVFDDEQRFRCARRGRGRRPRGARLRARTCRTCGGRATRR